MDIPRIAVLNLYTEESYQQARNLSLFNHVLNITYVSVHRSKHTLSLITQRVKNCSMYIDGRQRTPFSSTF
jgi:hypothetical protein